MLRLYDYLASGNGYKCRLLLHQLGLPYQRVELDILKGETRTPGFLARNPNGRIPALELEDGTVLAESDAILCYLADGTPFWPAQRLQRAQVLQWLFFEQYSHEPFVAVARFVRHFEPPGSPRLAELPRLEKGGHAALAVLEGRLRVHPYSPPLSLPRRRRGRLRPRRLPRRPGLARPGGGPTRPRPDHRRRLTTAWSARYRPPAGGWSGATRPAQRVPAVLAIRRVSAVTRPTASRSARAR